MGHERVWALFSRFFAGQRRIVAVAVGLLDCGERRPLALRRIGHPGWWCLQCSTCFPIEKASGASLDGCLGFCLRSHWPLSSPYIICGLAFMVIPADLWKK